MQILYFNPFSQLLSLAYFDGFQIVSVPFIAKFSQQKNLAQIFGTSKIHLIPPLVSWAAVHSKAVVLLLLTFCLLLLPFWDLYLSTHSFC